MGKPTEKQPNTQARRPAKRSAADEAILLNTAPAWLNWAAVMLAVLIVAGVFLLSARQLNAPQGGVSANPNNGFQAGVGGMRLDNSGLANGLGLASDAEAEETAVPTPASPWESAEPGEILSNPGGRVALFADADANASLLDSYGRGGVFVLLEPTGDHESYPVMVGDTYWVRVRAPDGLVGWTPAEALEFGP